MKRKRDGLISIGEAFSGPVKALREAPPQAGQLIGASEADKGLLRPGSGVDNGLHAGPDKPNIIDDVSTAPSSSSTPFYL